MIQWLPPTEVVNFGLVYMSSCRHYMIVRALGKYRLSYSDRTNGFARLGEYPQLKRAKEAAEQRQALCG
jgi:hypothetical protein